MSITKSRYRTRVCADDLVYLILTGRVSCRLKKNQSCKEYVSGSYFGDFDGLNNRSRLFSAKAEEPLHLIVIDRDELEMVLEEDPSSRLAFLKRTIRRFIDCKKVMNKLNRFNLLTERCDWWNEQETEDQTDSINIKIEKWIKLNCKMRKPKTAFVSYAKITQESEVTQNIFDLPKKPTLYREKKACSHRGKSKASKSR